MIRSIRIKYFKSHRDTRLVLHPRLNAIIGEGMSGKSNIIRAIKMVRWLRPISKRWRSSFAPEDESSSITIRTSDGFIVTWKRKKQAEYIVKNVKTRERQSFRKFGSQVPDIVENAINISDINFQQQLDSPYIVSITAGQVTRVINDVTKVSIADSWLSELNRKTRSYKVLVDDNATEQTKIKRKLRKLRRLDDVEPLVKLIKQYVKRIEKIEDAAIIVEGAIADIESAKRRIAKYNEAMKAEPLLKRHAKLNKERSRAEDKLDRLEDILSQMAQVKLLKVRHRQASKELLRALDEQKRCPYCYSKITRKRAKIIADAIRIN